MQTRWNLSDLYASNDEFNEDFKTAKELLDELIKFKNKLGKNDKKILKKYYEIDSKFSKILEKIAVFTHCCHDDDAKNELFQKNYALVNDFFSKAAEKLSFVRPELNLLDLKFLKDLKKDQDFADYSRDIEFIIRSKKHTLSEEKEGILAMISNFTTSDEVYSLLSDIEMNHGTIIGENGEEIKLLTGNYNLLLKNKSQNFRQNVMKTYLSEYGKLNMTFSELYISHVKHVNFIAKLRGFKSALDMETYEEEVPSDVMIKNIEFVRKKCNLLQEFFSLKKRILGLTDFYTSDINADVPTVQDNVTFEDAVADIETALSPLGEDYQKMFVKALDDGWIDVFPRETKASGGYTISSYSCHPYILLNFDGTAYWKSAIAHEFGHAMHSFYSSSSQPYPKADYTIFVAEVASLTNEILLAYHSLKNEKDRFKKMQIICDFLGTFYLNVFNSSMLAEFELFVHDNLWQGKTLTASDLNKKYVSLCNEYFNDSVTLVENFEFDWERKSHIFSDYYLYKYSTGFISACAVAEKILNDKTGTYLNKYREFLKLGDSIGPIESLLVAEIDITSEETFDFGFKIFETFLNELKTLFEEKL